jgi:phage-related protein
MDYTKVLSALSRVKAALEKKIDAVNTSVSGLPDTLDTQFTAVKNDIATVKTDVASVKQAITSANALADSINGEVV